MIKKTQNKAGDDAKNAVRKLCEFSHKQEQEISPIQWKENNLNASQMAGTT